MNLLTLNQTKTILIFTLVVALLGGVSYGGYRYWQSRQVAPEPQEPSVKEQKPEEEKKVEIVDNPDGSKTYYSYIYNYKLVIPEGWEVKSGGPKSGGLMNPFVINPPETAGLNPNTMFRVNAIRTGGVLYTLSYIQERASDVKEVQIGNDVATAYILPEYDQWPSAVKIIVPEGDYGYELTVISAEFFEQAECTQILNTFEFLEHKKTTLNTGASGHYIFHAPYEYDYTPQGEEPISQFVSMNLNNGQFNAWGGTIGERIASATLSRKGDKIAYFFGSPNGGSFAVFDLSNGQTKYYTLPEIPISDGKLVWSPDGGAIAYFGVGNAFLRGSAIPYYQPKTLYKIRISDGESSVLHKLGPEFEKEPCRLVSWLSPTEAIFTGGSEPQYSSTNFAGSLIGEGLYLLNLVTGKTDTLTEDFFYHVSVNPESRLVAYTTLNYLVDPREDILKILDISSRTMVFERAYKREAEGADVFFEPGLVWSSDGNSLFFSRADFSKQKERYDFWRVIEKLNLVTKQTETLFGDSGLHTAPVAEIDETYLLIYKDPPACTRMSDEEKEAGHIQDPGCREGFKRPHKRYFYLYNMETQEKTEYPDFEKSPSCGWDNTIGLTKVLEWP